MEITELQIGDWVKCTDPTPMQITRIDSRGMLVENQDTDEVGLEDLQPIPLTEEMLINNGFEDLGKYLRLQDNILMIHRNGGKLWVIIGTWAKKGGRPLIYWGKVEEYLDLSPTECE